MSAPVNALAVALGGEPYGAGVRLVAGGVAIETVAARVEGIIRRPAVARNEAEPGETLTITTSGGLFAEIVPGRPAWAEIRDGRILNG